VDHTKTLPSALIAQTGFNIRYPELRLGLFLRGMVPYLILDLLVVTPSAGSLFFFATNYIGYFHAIDRDLERSVLDNQYAARYACQLLLCAGGGS
jgi:hypothetical protein